MWLILAGGVLADAAAAASGTEALHFGQEQIVKADMPPFQQTPEKLRDSTVIEPAPVDRFSRHGAR
jgi:hypothetical protein